MGWVHGKCLLNDLIFTSPYSLDVEGSEFQILKTVPFNEVDIKIIGSEITAIGKIFPGTWEDILN